MASLLASKLELGCVKIRRAILITRLGKLFDGFGLRGRRRRHMDLAHSTEGGSHHNLRGKLHHLFVAFFGSFFVLVIDDFLSWSGAVFVGHNLGNGNVDGATLV